MTTEVTQGMFQQVMGYDSRTGLSTAWGDGADFPAYYVTWHMTAAFANAVTQRHNAVNGTSVIAVQAQERAWAALRWVTPISVMGYVLPTEAEWELAGKKWNDE